MKAPTLLLFEVWKRFGERGLRPIPVLDQVAPVTVVADVSNLAVKLDPPEGTWGFAAANVAGNFHGVQLIAGGGGLEILDWCSYNSAGTDSGEYVWGIATPNPTISSTGVPNPVNPRQPLRAIAQRYVQAASYLIGQTTTDQAYMGGSITATKLMGLQMKGPIFVPSGRAFIIEGFAANMAVRGFAHWREFPEGQVE